MIIGLMNFKISGLTKRKTLRNGMMKRKMIFLIQILFRKLEIGWIMPKIVLMILLKTWLIRQKMLRK